MSRPTQNGSYRLLFSDPRMVEDLLRGFVREPWVDRLDFGSLTPWDEAPDPASAPDSDRGLAGEEAAWRLRWRGGRSWIYLLLAFPAAVESRLALSFLLRAGRLFRDLERRGELPRSRRFPAAVGIALYAGSDGLWTAPREMADLVEPVPSGLEKYSPRLRHLLLDARREPIPETAGTANRAARLLLLERTHGLAANGAADLTQEPWRDPWEESRREAARREGAAELLARQLDHKFGPLDARDRAQLAAAGPERLLLWAERLLAAASMAEVLAD